MSDLVSTPTGSRLALAVLVALVVLSPWPFGSVHPLMRWLITTVCLVTTSGIALQRLRRGELVEIPTAAALGAGVFFVGLVQLIPLPLALHGWLAPGSAAIWHPEVPAAAEILGEGPRPISIWPEATRGAVAFGLGIIALATLAMPALRDRQRAVRAASIVVGSSLVVAVYGLVARLAFGDRLFGALSVPTVAPFGPFVSKNHFAGYVEVSALLALGLAAQLRRDSGTAANRALDWMEGPRAGRIVLAYAVVATLCLVVLISLSRGGALSLAAGMVAFAAMRSSGTPRIPGWRTPTLAVVLALGMAVFFVIPQDARDRLRTLTEGRRDAATAYRLSVWRDSLRLARSSPIAGYGLGAFVDALPRFKTDAADLRIDHAENDYLELLAEGGLFGLGLACAAIVALARSIMRRPTKERNQRKGHSLVHGAVAGLIAVGVHSLFDFNLRIPSNALLYALLASVAASKSMVSHGGLRTRHGLAVLCACLALAVPWSFGSTRLEIPYRTQHPVVGTSGRSLRVVKTTGVLAEHLGRRPAHAEAWIWLAWYQTRVPGGNAIPLARYAASLDPQRTELRAAADRVAP